MKEQLREYLIHLLYDIANTDPQVVLLIILLVAIVIVLDSISRFAKQQRKKVGLEDKSAEVTVHGTRSMPVRLYVSDMQGLAGKPDALISEDGYIIPIERKPLARKIRDRYVAQLLVYMRLVEEFEGKKPPYGYLVLGPNCRRVRVLNSPEKQAWLQKLIDEMRAIYTKEAQSVPAPHPRKCRKCNVRHACQARMDLNEGKEEPKKAKDGGAAAT